MELAGMMYAESAHVKQTLTVQGANWDGLTASSFPATHALTVVLLLRPADGDVGTPLPVELHVNDAAGAMAGHAHLDLNVNAWKEQTAIVVEVPCVFPQAGRYTLRFASGFGRDQLSFDVVGSGLSQDVATAVEGYALGLKQ